MWRPTDNNMNTHKGPLQRHQKPDNPVHEQHHEPRLSGLNMTTSVGVIVGLQDVISPCLVIRFIDLLGTFFNKTDRKPSNVFVIIHRKTN